MALKIEDDKETLYLRFLEEREKNCNCIGLNKKKGKLLEDKGYYYSSVPFNIAGDAGTFELIPTTIDKIEYFKVGRKIS